MTSRGGRSTWQPLTAPVWLRRDERWSLVASTVHRPGTALSAAARSACRLWGGNRRVVLDDDPSPPAWPHPEPRTLLAR
jgi:hypothetical protein